MPIDISDATLSGEGRVSGSFATTGTFVHNSDNDITFWVTDSDGRLLADGSLSADFYTGNLAADPILTGNASVTASYIYSRFPSAVLSALGELSSGGFYITYIRGNVVGWSKIGQAAITIDESNEAGYAPLPGDVNGKVVAILSLKDRLAVVYSTSGIYLLDPVTAPFATFAIKRFEGVGVLKEGCVCGDHKSHFFINKNYELCLLSQSVTISDRSSVSPVKNLGYAEFIKGLMPNNEAIMMGFDSIAQRVYISSSVGGYILTEEGLGGGFANLTSVGYGVFGAPSAIVSPVQEICTDVLDFKYRGQKTLYEISLGINTTEQVYVAIDFRFDTKEEFRTSAWIRANKEGVAFPVVAGVEFRIRVKVLNFANFQIDYISARFKTTDKRFKRGMNALEQGA